MTLSELVAVEVMGFPKPPDMTYQQASKEDGGNASCFQIVRDGWVAYVDWGTVTKTQLYSEMVEWKPDADYTGEIDAAWRIVENLRSRKSENGERWRVAITGTGDKWIVDVEDWKARIDVSVCNDDVCIAICIAALLACGVSEDRIEQARKGSV